MRRLLAVAFATALLLGSTTYPAAATATTTAAQRLQIEQAFQRLGLPVGKVDRRWDDETRRATCMWRELTGRLPYRSLPTNYELQAILATQTLTVQPTQTVGLNIDVSCQAATWVGKRWGYPTAGPAASPTATPTTSASPSPSPVSKPGWIKFVKAVFQVSTGMPDSYPTKQGTFSITWKVNGWWQSTIYADGKMYRPMFFAGGQALHGSITDDLVHVYPASHGCVRMLHADVDALWAAGFGHGNLVRVYGVWRPWS